MLFNRHCRLRI